MKIVLLTTDTTHHRYFAQKLSERYALAKIVVETRSLQAPFETAHSFEKERDEYEREVLLDGMGDPLSSVTETMEVGSMNSAEAIGAVKDVGADAVLVFGTGRLGKRLIEASGSVCLNLHGGNPESYRGLDSHLWAIYHRDFANVVTALHFVAPALDTGDIVFQAALPLTRSSQFHELRSINTRVCVELVSTALGGLHAHGWIPRRRQVQLGRYYSFMPSCLKEICLHTFARHVGQP